jgi:hypothetical protein
MKCLFSDRTNLDESLHSAVALNRMQACHYCSILLWNQLHVAFSTVAECIIVSERLALSFRISITFLLGYDVTLTFPSRLMPLFFQEPKHVLLSTWCLISEDSNLHETRYEKLIITYYFPIFGTLEVE